LYTKTTRHNGESSHTYTWDRGVHAIRQDHTANQRRIKAVRFKVEVLVETGFAAPGPPSGFLGIDTHPEVHGPQFVPFDRLLASKRKL